jgi:CheY-like chemotaxis protein
MKSLQILLVEDNRGDIFLIQRALAENHIEHELHVVRDGEEALGFVLRMSTPIGAPCPDVVLLDLNLPKADGVQVLSALRKHPECAATPVIVVTSSDAPKDRDRVAALGVNRYFKKPFDLDEYMELGKAVLEVVKEAPPHIHH